MPVQTWRAPLNSPAVGPGTALANSIVLTDISPPPQLIIPAGWLYPGQRLCLEAYGIFSTTTGTPTLQLGVYWGGASTGTALATTAANATTSSLTSAQWQLRLNVRVVTVGATGTVWCAGWAKIGSSLTVMTEYALPSGTNTAVTINTVSALTLTVGAQWGTASTLNTITCEDAIIESF